MITPTAVFKDNLALLPSIEGLARLELFTAEGALVGTIENAPGKQGSLKVYHYLGQIFGALTAEAALLGLEIFAEHTEDAKARPGAHPNIDRLLVIAGGAPALEIKAVLA